MQAPAHHGADGVRAPGVVACDERLEAVATGTLDGSPARRLRIGLSGPASDADKDAVTELAAELETALEQARAGDSRGFDVLFRTFGASVAGYLRARSVSDPDGVANDVFLRAFRTIHTFQGDERRFRSWLFTIAHNAAIDDARRRRRRVRESTLDAASEPSGGDVEADALERLGQQRITGLLAMLSPDQRDVVVLRVVSDLSVEETAAVVGKSYEAVKALQRRGLAALRRALSDHEAVPR